jgi:hypothetical protein
MNKFTTRAYNSFIVPKNKNSIIKKSKDKKLLDEIEYYKFIPKELKLFFPRFVDGYSDNDGFNYLELEYYAYEDLGIKMIYRQFDSEFWKNLFLHIDSYFDIYKKISPNISTYEDSIKMFIDKTYEQYLNLTNKSSIFSNLINEEEIFFNGKKLRHFNEIWDTIKTKILDSCIPSEFYYFHGDFCFNNIIYGINNKSKDVIFKFIDPRGKFGNTLFYGDNYYDLAKLSHSCSGGYEYLINDEFNLIEIDKNKFEFNLSNNNYKKINEIFLDYVNGKNYDLQRIKIIEGCIFIGMCPHHYDSLVRQKSMFLIGLNLLNEIYEKI